MRLWSIHPKYLDSKGLVAVWREALLAKNVLENKTRGYKNHPQLARFIASDDPLNCIHQYLLGIHDEAERRGYVFDKNKISKNIRISSLTVTAGQVAFEIGHLKAKLEGRDRIKFEELSTVEKFEPHPLFKLIQGEREYWERSK